jgi:hypothetical protein
VRDFFEKATAVKAAFEAKEIAVNSTDVLWSRSPDEAKSEAVQKVAEVCSIHLRSEDGDNYRFELKVGSQPACIGRAAGNRLRIEDTSISRVHCSLAMRSDGQVVLADLHSSNGTALNGKQVNPNEARPIQKGDVITVGDIKLSVIEML